MKKVSKNLLKNLRISLNVYERQKYCTKKKKKKKKKKTYDKAKQQLLLLYHEFCINLKT